MAIMILEEMDRSSWVQLDRPVWVRRGMPTPDTFLLADKLHSIP